MALDSEIPVSEAGIQTVGYIVSESSRGQFEFTEDDLQVQSGIAGAGEHANVTHTLHIVTTPRTTHTTI